MRLKVLASGSKGNCYVLTDENGYSLILDVGVKLIEVKKCLKFDLRKVVAVLLTHRHLDHSKYAQQYMDAGIPVYTNGDCIRDMKLESHRVKEIKDLQMFQIPKFKVKPFDLQHDVKNHGFIIKHVETGNTIVYITDTYYCKYVIPGMNNILLEANYCDKILEKKLQEGMAPSFLRNRIIESHFSLKNAKGFLEANDLSKMNNIVLIHLSDTNSHAERFKKEVEDLTTKTVHIAEKGLETDLSITPF